MDSPWVSLITAEATGRDWVAIGEPRAVSRQDHGRVFGRRRPTGQPTSPPSTIPASGANGTSVVTLTVMPTAKPSKAPSAIVVARLTRVSLCVAPGTTATPDGRVTGAAMYDGGGRGGIGRPSGCRGGAGGLGPAGRHMGFGGRPGRGGPRGGLTPRSP